MAFISMCEVRNKRVSHPGRGRGSNYGLLGYSNNKGNLNKKTGKRGGGNYAKTIVFYMKSELMRRANIGLKTKVNVMYEPTTKECVIETNTNGWAITSNGSNNSVGKIALPFWADLGFPSVDSVKRINPGRIHASAGKIVFFLEWE